MRYLPVPQVLFIFADGMVSIQMTCKLRLLLPALCVALLLAACGGSHSSPGGENVADSLNERAYHMHYVSLDSTERLAQQAWHAAGRGKWADGQQEALCHLAFAASMRMDFRRADSLYGLVLGESRNELLKLVADVGMMRVCQRRSANKDFYDYRNSALTRMERLRAEAGSMTPHQRLLWNFARSDYHLTLSTYYYYLRQEPEAEEQYRILSDSISMVEHDSAQLALYCFLAGNARTVAGRLGTVHLDYVMRGLAIAQAKGYSYILSKAMTTLAQDFVHNAPLRPSLLIYLRELPGIPDTVGRDGMSLALCRSALRRFERYGSLFDMSETYITISDFYLYRGDSLQALEALRHSLELVNRHHALANPADTLSPELLTYEPDAGAVSTEMQWIGSHDTMCVPEWMADVREHLCLVYSALGMKHESDYNRNIYLDILDATRQDRRMEQRAEALAREEKTVNRTILVAGMSVLLVVLLLVVLSRRIRANYASNYQRERNAVEAEMARWRERTDRSFASLEDVQESVEVERFNNERHLAEQKRQYIDKTTCLSIVYAITPFLDRVLCEVRKITGGTRLQPNLERLQYVSELTGRISLYNDILAHWIKVRRGTVSLHIENFALQPLFDIMAKSERLFLNKGLQLRIEPTQGIVKADKALTLFMMNTLMENARKYTQEGGSVRLSAETTERYVEISVSDTGRGLSNEDLHLIRDGKVYDSGKIGDVEHDADLAQNKGYGFGLMNCRGIIEQYKKVNPLFDVCLFSVESRLGQGSRFFFRLPKGVTRALLMVGLWLLPAAVLRAASSQETEVPQPFSTITDSLPHTPQAPRNPLLLRAGQFADSVYYANVDGFYERALGYVDSACHYLNAFYLQSHPGGTRLMRLCATDSMPEITLWGEGFNTDYHIILDIRNEAAIAALALHLWNVYYYNNEIYTRLYKLMAQDTQLDQFCLSVKEANANKRTALIFMLFLVLLAGLAYFTIYYRDNILTMFNMRQILELSRRIFNRNDESRLADIICSGVNDIRRTDGVCLLFQNGRLQFSEGCPQQEYLREVMHAGMDKQGSQPIVLEQGKVRIYPLTARPEEPADTEAGGEGRQPEQHVIGALALVLHQPAGHQDDDALFELIAQYTATNLYFSSVRLERLRNEIEILQDERRRSEQEANAVHVQNMVLDNCLSTIKHETMYYPSRIQQVADGMLKARSCDARQLADLAELLTYYKEVFTILSACAARQVDTVLFRRQHIPLTDLTHYAEKSFRRQLKHTTPGRSIRLEATADGNGCVLGDRTLLEYLLDNLLSVGMQDENCGRMSLRLDNSEEFVKFAMSFEGITLSAERLGSLFYPESLSYDTEHNQLTGAQFLIARQIVREHDEHVRRGCRIYATSQAGDPGLQVCFTIPAPSHGRDTNN